VDKKYFLKKNTNMSGPYSLTTLKAKDLKPSDLVWFEDLADWTPAGNIERLEITAITPPTQPRKRTTLKKILSRLLPAGK
jgi:hypothetical protein